MSARRAYRYVPPRDAGAEQVCLLDREGAARRTEPVDALLAQATSQAVSESGAEYRFPLVAGIGARIDTFIAEEGECCPFFAFETWEEPGEAVLRVIRPPGE